MFRYVSRSSGLASTILQGTAVKGKEEKVGDNIKEWMGMHFSSLTRTAEHRCKGIVAISSVVPRRPSKVMG